MSGEWTKDGAAFWGDENSCDDETSENVHSKVRFMIVIRSERQQSEAEKGLRICMREIC